MNLKWHKSEQILFDLSFFIFFSRVWIEPRLAEDLHDDFHYRKNYDPYEQDLFNFPDRISIFKFKDF